MFRCVSNEHLCSRRQPSLSRPSHPHLLCPITYDRHTCSIVPHRHVFFVSFTLHQRCGSILFWRGSGSATLLYTHLNVNHDFFLDKICVGSLASCPSVCQRSSWAYSLLTRVTGAWLKQPGRINKASLFTHMGMIKNAQAQAGIFNRERFLIDCYFVRALIKAKWIKN